MHSCVLIIASILNFGNFLFMKRFCHDPQLASCIGTSVVSSCTIVQVLNCFGFYGWHSENGETPFAVWNLGPTNDFPFPRSGGFRPSDKGVGGGGRGEAVVRP